MKFLMLALMAIIPSFIILILVYKKDIEKEPIKLLLGMFGMGIISCFIAAQLTSIFEMFFPFLSSEHQESFSVIRLFLYSFITISTIEEFSKWLFNYNVVWNNKEFNHLYDSIVYSVFFALGFGTLENILYVLLYGFNAAVLRAFLSIPAHAFFGIAMGYYIGMAKQANYNGKKNLEKKYKVYSLIVPILLHGFYDFCLFSGNKFLLYLNFLFIIYIYVKGFITINKMSSVKTNIINN